MRAVLRSLLLLFMFSMGNAKAHYHKCPYGWKNFGIRCYKHFPETVKWITAERNCQGFGANLASAHSKPENDFLLSLIPASTHCWLGAHDGEEDGQWLWTDGSPHDYTNWCSGQPNNYDGPENCLELSYTCKNSTAERCWNDAPCAEQMSFLCAKDL